MINWSNAPIKWLLFFILALAGGIASYYYFPLAYPIIHLDLSMNRPEAIEQARAVAEQYHLGPDESSSAASFFTDEQTKTFVELEAGGKKALVAMMDENRYQPYRWLIRLFKPFDQHELLAQFTPGGIPYGFKETLSENLLRPELTATQAQQHAEQFAKADPWSVDFSQYKLVEFSQEKKTSGRVDHMLVYERTDVTIGEGFYRLKIVVSGNAVSELNHSVKVPDTFVRRYTQMRSANSNLAYLATMAMVLLYLFGCCMIGIFYLFQQRWILWKKPFFWALFVSFLSSSTAVNELPLAWMSYNTALNPYGFLAQKAIGIIFYFLMLIAGLFLIFTAAESLTRKAFGNQPQLWKLFDPAVANSYTVLGYTVFGYLVVPFLFSYTTLFYVFSTRWFGWWVPSTALFNPNILATYVPWLEPIVLSLQAGFMEECLFRAVPLASAALLGTRFGKRNWWIFGAFILQAIIFGAAHANYPAQPAYARVAELLIVSFIFGGVYLRLGLYPAIITHFVYDVVWFALPLFVSTAPGVWVYQTIVIACAAIPAGIVVWARITQGKWTVLPEALLNRSWQPPAMSYTAIDKIVVQATPFSFAKKVQYGTLVLGILSAVVIALTCRFSSDSPSFSTSRGQAAVLAQNLMQEKNIDLTHWTQLMFPFKHFEQHPDSLKQHRFIWQKGRKPMYDTLMSTYLLPPHWSSRFVLFNGPIEKRAEEYIAMLKPDGTLLRFIHKLPENAPGADISQTVAKQMALEAIHKQFGLTIDQLTEISAIAQKQPNRLDWIVTYADNAYSLDNGQARIAVTIAQNEIVDTERFIHVPEEWERAEQNIQLIAMIIGQLCRLFIYLIVSIGAIIALRRWNAAMLRSFSALFALFGTLFIFELFNAWPTVLSTFNTSQPFNDQLFRSFTFPIILLLLRAAILAVALCFVTYNPSRYRLPQSWYRIAMGISLGLILASLQCVAEQLIPLSEPTWTNYTALGFAFPFSAGIASILFHYFAITTIALLGITALNWWSKYWTARKICIGSLLLCSGFIVSGMLYANTLPLFFGSGLLFGIFLLFSYVVILRFDESLIPIVTATYFAFYCAQQTAMNGYPMATAISLTTAILIVIIGLVWHKKISSALT